MFAHATHKPAVPGSSLIDSVRDFFATAYAAYTAAQRASRLYEELSQLSDKQLAARGLTRDDVNRLTLQTLSGETAA